jgi:hypothetical protein
MGEPLIVMNAFVIRADSTPPSGHRAARPGYNVNRAGQGIEDPATTERTLALTGHPQFEWEAFDEYWRKTHGPKILHVDGATDRQTALLRYYLQQHRIPGGPTSERTPPYSADPDAAGLLPLEPAARCAAYQRPQWDGLAQLGFDSKAALEGFFDLGPGKYGDKIVPDEAVFIRGFAFHLAEEHIVIGREGRRRDPIVLLKLHTRDPATSRAQFRGRWMAQHADCVRRLAAGSNLIRRYAQLVNVSEAADRLYDPEGDRIDGVGALSFANINDLEDFLAGPEGTELRADEQAFAAETRYFTALNYVIREPA